MLQVTYVPNENIKRNNFEPTEAVSQIQSLSFYVKCVLKTSLKLNKFF